MSVDIALDAFGLNPFATEKQLSHLSSNPLYASPSSTFMTRLPFGRRSVAAISRAV
jgi:hypothetical protein